MYYLGIDWGEKKCGIAIADNETLIASVYKQALEIDLYQEVFDFLQKEKVEKIVIGCHDILKKNERFNNFLNKINQLGIEIELEGEEFSTRVAQENLKDVKSRGISGKDDAESARVILQGWLDKNFSK